MAATVVVERHTGAASGGDGGTTRTDITSINTRASVADTHYTTETTNPIPIPAAGTNYSAWVSTRLNCTAAPTGTIDNIKWYSDAASFGTGVTVVGADASTSTDEGYRIATTGPPTELTQANHTGLDAAPVDVTGLTSGSPRTIGGSIVATTGTFGDFFVYQFQVGSTAGAGATNQNTFTWQYDET